MTETLVGVADPPPAEATGRRVASGPVLLALLAVLAAVVAGAAYLTPQPPADDSVDVGFARDMSRHHSQAVAMAESIRDRTEDPALRLLAADISLTQQAQIGMMSGWLTSWGRSSTVSGAQMAWMGTPTTGLMPGMASSEEVQALATLPVQQAEDQFLRLMVSHHTGGIAMAKAGAELAQQQPVVALAEGIAAAQASEIEYFQSLLAARGAPPAVPSVAALDHVANGHHGGGVPLRTALLLTLVTLGLLAFLWLLVDAVVERLDRPVLRADGAVGALVAGGVVTAAVHLILTPSHAAESTASGLFFLLAALATVLGAAMAMAGASRTGAVLLATSSVVLIGVYVAFRLVPPPGAAVPEGVDAWGLVAVGAEVVILAAAGLVLRRPSRGRLPLVGERRTPVMRQT